MDFHTGDIIFFEPVSLKGKIITFLEKGKWAHVGMVLEIIEGEVVFLESEWKGTRIQVLKPSWENFEVWRPSFSLKKTKKEMLQQVGKRYDFAHLFWTGMRIIFKHNLKIPATDDREYICSELVHWTYDYQIVPRGTATPYTLYEALKNSPLSQKIL